MPINLLFGAPNYDQKKKKKKNKRQHFDILFHLSQLDVGPNIKLREAIV